MTENSLSPEQFLRYNRHLLLPGFGEEGQRKLYAQKMLVCGTGGLGSPAAFYLAAAGVGTLGLLDCDRVEISNLNRQILHSTEDIGVEKTYSAAFKLKRLNPDAVIVEHNHRLTSEDMPDIFSEYDIVLDCTDNYHTRFLLNDTCIQLRIPLIHAGVSQYKGQAMTILPGQSACYRCLFPEEPPQDPIPSGYGAPILGAIPGILGSIQAVEAIKRALEIGELLTNKILTVDALSMEIRTFTTQRDANCPVCGG
ncbi:adenylyltransferase [bacterium]|nr:adenylyltransferase [bacterium]